jgi:hypothetical protein
MSTGRNRLMTETEGQRRVREAGSALRLKLEQALRHLPDGRGSGTEDWQWCWDGLYSGSQDEVKRVRREANEAAAAFDQAVADAPNFAPLVDAPRPDCGGTSGGTYFDRRAHEICETLVYRYNWTEKGCYWCPQCRKQVPKAETVKLLTLAERLKT